MSKGKSKPQKTWKFTNLSRVQCRGNVHHLHKVCMGVQLAQRAGLTRHQTKLESHSAHSNLSRGWAAEPIVHAHRGHVDAEHCAFSYAMWSLYWHSCAGSSTFFCVFSTQVTEQQQMPHTKSAKTKQAGSFRSSSAGAASRCWAATNADNTTAGNNVCPQHKEQRTNFIHYP